jgi:hypothetical protein
LSYFFWPQSFKISNKDQVYIQIDKQIEGIDHNYVLNEQEVKELVNILEKSKICRGVSRPDQMFAGKSIRVIVDGGLSTIITIYYDANKTYIFANNFTGIFFNVYYRISNKEDIKNYIEDVVNTRIDEFKKVILN